MACVCGDQIGGAGGHTHFREEEVYVFDLEDFARTVIDFHNAMSDNSFKAIDLATVTGTLLDKKSGIKLLNELGIKGKYVLKTINGQQYVILKGYPGLREVLKGTRYLANNPKVVQFGLGGQGIRAAARTNVIIMIVAYTALDVTQYILSDEQSLSFLLSSLTVNVGIGFIAITIGAAVAKGLVGGVVLTVAAPAAVATGGAIVVGLIASSILTYAANNDRTKEKLSEAIDYAAAAAKAGIIGLGTWVENAHLSLKQRLKSMNRSVNRFNNQLEHEIIRNFYPDHYHSFYRR